jgi:hypothetical protein
MVAGNLRVVQVQRVFRAPSDAERSVDWKGLPDKRTRNPDQSFLPHMQQLLFPRLDLLANFTINPHLFQVQVITCPPDKCLQVRHSQLENRSGGWTDSSGFPDLAEF